MNVKSLVGGLVLTVLSGIDVLGQAGGVSGNLAGEVDDSGKN